MKKVTILGFHNTMATTIFGPMDILNQAGRLFNRLEKSPLTPYFDITIASPDGQPIRSANNIMIQPHCSIQEIKKTDLIIIASATYIDKILDKNPELVPWIQNQYSKGAHVASICTGVFLLAETGLLDGKSATLHWGFTQIFQKRYPKVNLRDDKMFIDHGRLYCSAGVAAGMDLSLYLVEKFCGKKAAVQSAKTMVLDMGRKAQTPYDCNLFAKEHGDSLILKCQSWIEKYQTKNINYNSLAKRFKMGRRSFERRFKKAAGMTPLGYLQLLRVERAKQLLEQTSLSFNEITYKAGYEDVPFFRKVFVRLTGLKPKEYQQRFAGYSARPL